VRARSTLRPVAVASAALILLAACGAGDRTAAPSPAQSTTTTPTRDQPAMSWTSPFEVTVPNGWTIRDCEGERLNVCVYDGSRSLGDIELNTDYPLDSIDVGRDPAATAHKLAEAMTAHFRDDRARGCSAFTFTGDTVRAASVGGKPSARGGFTLTNREGRVVERVINYYLVEGAKFAIVNIDAYVSEGGCLGPTEYDPTFTPADLDKLEPHLDSLVAATPTTATR
jgi:hypothetical protein